MLLGRESNLCAGRFDRHRIGWVCTEEMRTSHPRQSHTSPMVEPTERTDCNPQLRFRFDLVHILSAGSARTGVGKVQCRSQHPGDGSQSDRVRGAG